MTVLADFVGPGGFSVVPGSPVTIGDDNQIVFFAGLLDSLVIAATGFNDDWAVASINIAPVPLPAAGILFGSALGLAGLYRKRKAAASATKGFLPE